MKTYTTSLFIFRRDLRLSDNAGLNAARAQSDKVIPCFILDPRQVGDTNEYKSNNALQFMSESLIDLDRQLHKHDGKLYLFYAAADEIIEQLLQSKKIDAVFFNRDYTPFSIKRDNAIKKLGKKYDCAIECYADALLNEPEAVVKNDGSPYSIFSAFYKKALILAVKEPENLKRGTWFDDSIAGSHSMTYLKKIIPSANVQIACKGGSNAAAALCEQIASLKNYNHDRDYPIITTSHLSAHLKFGTLSIRKTYQTIVESLGRSHPLLRQLYWRDFFTHIGFHMPDVFSHAYHKKYDRLVWNNDKELFNAWCTGTTGFPIVDAGMRELNTTGFMHNRVRMIVASFLVKDLHINWQWGERYFAQQLVDYDPAVNNGNWQWSASTGCDAQPYFRIFNPWLQQKKFDSLCEYIKKWVPELQLYDPKTIHNLFKEDGTVIKNYPRPIVDHQRESMFAKKMYRDV